MLKKINQLLKLVGFNLVHAKRPKHAGYRSHVRFEDAKTDAKCIPSPTCCQDEYNAGKTNSTGGGCSGHATLGYPAQVQVVDSDAAFEPVDIGVGQDERPRVKQPISDNNITGPTS